MQDAALDALLTHAAGLIACVAELPEALFLRPMHAWSPRDVVAHLIGWNRATIDGCSALMRGELPAYFADSTADFATVNRRSVERYADTDRDRLLDELRVSLEELRRFLARLPAAAWGQDYGARSVASGPLLIRRQVELLADDYAAHHRELREWARTVAVL